LERILERDPPHAVARERLGNSHFGRALALGGLGRHGDAAQAWEQAAAHNVHGEAELFRFSAVVARARQRGALPTPTEMAGYAAATARAEAFAQRGLLPAITFYHFAHVLALAANAAKGDERLTAAQREQLAEHYAAQAVEILAKARATGLFRTEEYRRDLETSRELESLRSRADFQELLVKVQDAKS
jgi:hypothetical protein